jgi:hypothetical protein
MANATSTQLQELYVAYFGRAADPTGLDYWTESGITQAAFAANMYAQNEFKSAYGSKSVEAQVNQIYKNLFDREADVTGLTYWTQQINLGNLKVAEIATHLIYAAKNNAGSADDKTALTNRTNAAVAYTAKVKESTANILAYQPTTTDPWVAGTNISEAISYLTGIDKDTAHTAAGVTASVAKFTSTTTAVTAKSLTLTTAVDTITGGAGDDVISGVIGYTASSTTATTTSTFSAADIINAGAGTDTFKITVDTAPSAATTLPAFTGTGLETVQVRNVSGQATTQDVGNVGGLTGVVNYLSTGAVDFDNIGTGDLTIVGNDAVTNGNTTFSSSASDTVTDALTIYIKDGVGAGTITSNHANDDWTAVTINTSGGTNLSDGTPANVVGNLDLAAGNLMQTLTIDAATDFRTGSIIGWDTATTGIANKGKITVKGAGKVDLDGAALNAAVQEVDASANTGGVYVDASTQTDFQFTGGSGNDRFQTDVALSTTTGSAGAINGGAGTDRLIVNASTDITEAIGALYTNFEVLEVQNGVSVDMDHLSGITAIRITDGAGATGVTDLSAAQAGAITLTAGGANAVTMAVKGAATIGQLDTITLAIDDGATAEADLTLTAPVMASVETFVINAANDAVSVSALTGATALTSIDINATHSSGVTTTVTSGAVAFGTNTHFDASDSTGPVEINLNGIVNGTGSSATRITGGSGDDSLTTSGAGTLADVVQGGGGIDTIVITSDAATAEIVTVISEATTSASADFITGFQSAEDEFDYNGGLTNGSGSGAISTGEVASAATIVAGLATADAANDTVFIATTDATDAQLDTSLDAFTGGASATTAQAVEDDVLATGGYFNGAMANLDTILSATDVVLFVIPTDAHVAIFRITNTDTSTANTLIDSEIELIAANTLADMVAADFM